MYTTTDKCRSFSGEIEKLAKQEGVSFLKACSAMQAAAASKGAEDVIEAIADIKEECD